MGRPPGGYYRQGSVRDRRRKDEELRSTPQGEPPDDLASRLRFEAEIGMSLVHEMTTHAYRMLSYDEHLADDAVSEALGKAWRGWNTFGGRSSVKTWVFAILNRTITDSFRYSQAHPTTLLETTSAAGREGSGPTGEARDNRPGPEEVAVIHVDLVRALATLAPDLRQAVLLHEYGFTDDEVGEILGVCRQTVLAWRHRGYRSVADLLSVPSTTSPVPALGADRRATTEHLQDGN